MEQNIEIQSKHCFFVYSLIHNNFGHSMEFIVFCFMNTDPNESKQTVRTLVAQYIEETKYIISE